MNLCPFPLKDFPFGGPLPLCETAPLPREKPLPLDGAKTEWYSCLLPLIASFPLPLRGPLDCGTAAGNWLFMLLLDPAGYPDIAYGVLQGPV